MHEEPATLIARLRARIPAFACRPGCHDCCGPVFFSQWEWAQLGQQREPIDLACPYDSGQGCTIYADRPLICRLHGAVAAPTWRCPHGLGPAAPIPWDEARTLLHEYHAMMEREEALTPAPTPGGPPP